MSQYCNIRSHLIVALSILFACLAPHTSWALQLSQGDGVEAPVSLGGHLSVLRDPTGALTIEDIEMGGDNIRFEPVPSMLTEGYRKGAIWVRFSLSAPSATNQWLLEVERPLIEHVTLYAPDETGRLTASPEASGDGVRAYPTLFPLSVPSIEHEYYIRLESMTSITTSLRLWQEKGFQAHRRSNDWIMGMAVGAIMAMICANLLYAVWLKDSLYLLYAASILVSGLVNIFHMGYSSDALYYLQPQWAHRIWGIIVCFNSIFTVSFLARLFELRRHWIWAWRIVQGITLLNCVALIFSIAGYYGDVAFFVSRLHQVAYIFIALLVLFLLIVRQQSQYLLPALAFATLLSITVVMQAQYTGVNILGVDSSLSKVMVLGNVLHLVLLSAVVARRAQFAERSLSEEKDRVIAVSRLAEQNLTIKVRERTAELAERNASLKTEVDRRHLLEVKLRQSLDSVNDALAQQRGFLALVSHEFRGPLAVIAAAAGNLSLLAAASADEIKLRTTRIRKAVRRMSTLIENVLASDQLNRGQSPFSTLGIFDLNEILQNARAGLDDDAAKRVSFIHGDAAPVKGDRNLLEILVQNLIQNALKYSDATSTVTVRLSTCEGKVFVEVIDSGTGVAVENRELIFLMYYRAAGQNTGGSGLGLYISREIARQYGGDLILAASDASGSTFRLSLPLDAADPGQA